MTDQINPDYYKDYSIEVTDAIQAWQLNYCQGNIIKYIVRCGRKTDDQKELSQYE